jgi:two-component system OmpR family sensor kinase
MSLRARLLIGVTVLVAVAAVVLGFVTTTSLRSFLINEVDQQLVSSQRTVAHRVIDEISGPGLFVDGGDGGRNLSPTSFYVEVADPTGTLVAQTNVGLRGSSDPPPALTTDELRLNASGVPSGSNQPFTVVAQNDPSLSYRVLLSPLPGGVGSLVLAAPLRSVEATVHRLILIEILAGIAVVAIVGAVSFYVVRLGLRPLDDVTDTASAIAAGDLSQRVEETESRTEVGRLASAFNNMLSRIETAFRERERSESRLRESEHRLRRFVADASHELRTPLTSIRGFAELFRQGAVRTPAEVEKAMGRIEENSSRMALLVDELLLLARLDQEPSVVRSPVDISGVVHDAVTDARAVEPGRPISLDADRPLIVEGNEVQLRQAVANLLSNARVHTPPETPVHVRVSSQDDSVVVEVADEGPGMGEEQAARAFERFYRADPSRSRGQGGTGLGLSIVAAIAAAHGGRASVESSPGRGANFRFEIPVLRPEPEAPGEATTEGDPPARPVADDAEPAGPGSGPEQSPPVGAEAAPAERDWQPGRSAGGGGMI